jgi:sterol desaturase/sphingolipid hydroxylase (fatty acid hydroxylase superfamily)
MHQVHHVRSTGVPAAIPTLHPNGDRKVYPRDSVRIFDNEFLERFSHVHPAVPAFLWIPLIAVLVYRSFAVHENDVANFALYGFAGLFFWTLTEYALHRFIFHFPAKSPFGLRMVYLMHGLHHEDPADPTRLVMPPLPAIIYSAILIPVFRYFIGAQYAEAFIAFFLVGYLAYDYTHYYIHHFNARTPVGKFLKKHHLRHHFANYESKWGVSNPLWDYVFGSVEVKGESKDSASRIKTA